MGISYIVINFSFISDNYFFFFLSSDLKFQQSVSFLIFWGVLSVNLPIHLFVFPSFFNIYANLNTVLFFSSNECLDPGKTALRKIVQSKSIARIWKYMHHNLADVNDRLILKIAGSISEKAETVGILLFSKYFIDILLYFNYF